MKKKLISLAVALLSSLAFGQVGINTLNPQGIFNVDGAKDNSTTGTPTIPQQANDFVVTPSGSTGIGTSQPNASAILDLNVDGLSFGSKKGFLAPRVALRSNIDVATIPNPAKGLMVFNLGTNANFNYLGYVFWNGTEWRPVGDSSVVAGTIDSITCSGASLSPNYYSAGREYTGTMSVPYTGGNGGAYEAQVLGPVNGLTASLSSGSFANGNGILNYTITGTPTVTSPSLTTFRINIGGKTCNASVGSSEVLNPGELAFYKTTIDASTAGVWLSEVAPDEPLILEGKIQLDAYFNLGSNGGDAWISMFPRLVNISSKPIKIWFSALSTVDSFNAGNYLLAAKPATGKSYVDLDNGIFLGFGMNDMLGITPPRSFGLGLGGNQEVETVDISFDGKWFRVYFFPIVDNMDTFFPTDNKRVIFMSVTRLY